MTQEEKQLLLKDLCARLPYGIKIHFDNGSKNGRDFVLDELSDLYIYRIEYFKPYLRPMSSMTEEEKKEFESLGWRVDELDGNVPWNHDAYNVFEGVDWLNAHHFDYRGLIEKGLALEAKEGMYNQ